MSYYSIFKKYGEYCGSLENSVAKSCKVSSAGAYLAMHQPKEFLAW